MAFARAGGQALSPPPIFRSNISYLVLNPTWTVPPGIEANDILPAVKRDRRYLAAKNLRIIDAQGRTIDPAAIDWNRYSGRSFAYTFRQDPGPDNALGQVKFMFPNPLPVLLYYWTAQGQADGNVHFKNDVCRRDPAVLKALDSEFKFRKQPVTKDLGYSDGGQDFKPA